MQLSVINDIIERNADCHIWLGGDVHCCTGSHIDNVFVNYNITQACLAVGEASLPRICVGSSGHIAGWNDIVAPEREKSVIYQNGICSQTFIVSNGVEQGGVISPILVRSKLRIWVIILAVCFLGLSPMLTTLCSPLLPQPDEQC